MKKQIGITIDEVLLEPLDKAILVFDKKRNVIELPKKWNRNSITQYLLTKFIQENQEDEKYEKNV